MALARIQYESDGSTTTYSIPFPYIARDDIQVSIDGTETQDFSFLDDSTIDLDSAPDQGLIIDIVRQTERENLLVEFNDGSTLLESDLTLAAQQSFFIAQESFDQTGSTMAVANDGSYSASDRRISSLGYPTEQDDASTKSYVDDIFAQGEDAYAMAVEAQNWANYPEDELVPEGDEVDDYSALHHKEKAIDAQLASETARDTANLWAEEAEDTEVAPGEYSAYHHRAKAEEAQSFSESARDKSQSWAEEDEDVEVETGAYSSKHHALKSSDSASAASTSESNAATSETNAADSEAKAQLWAEEAEDIEVETGEYSAYHWKQKAESWAQSVNMPSASGNGGKLIRQAADESGFEYITPSEGRTLLDVYSTGDADGKFAQLSGGSDADFSSRPKVNSQDVGLKSEIVGIGQTWQDVTSSRSLSTTYTNTTNKPIVVSVKLKASNTESRCGCSISVGGLATSQGPVFPTISGTSVYPTALAIVPPGSDYVVSATIGHETKFEWKELR